MIRYLTGLASAFLVYVVVFTAIVVSTSPASRTRVPDVLAVAMGFGVVSIVVLTLIIGPAVVLARTALRGRFHPAAAALLGAAMSPLCLLALWFLFRESNETIGGLLAFWRRVPGEFVFGLLPHALASAVFGAWIARGAAARALPTPARG